MSVEEDVARTHQIAMQLHVPALTLSDQLDDPSQGGGGAIVFVAELPTEPVGRFEDRPLGARGVVLGEVADGFEELRPARIVEEAAGEGARRRAEPVGYGLTEAGEIFRRVALHEGVAIGVSVAHGPLPEGGA